MDNRWIIHVVGMLAAVIALLYAGHEVMYEFSR